jgi:type IV pilus assembly protein PilA
MKMFTKRMHRGEKGFTLIELLIVVAILGIIAAVVIPNIAGFMITGQLSAANTEVEQVKTARLGYFGDYGDWPTDSSLLVPTYLSGAPKAVYDIDDDYGWVVDIVSSNWTTGITFEVGTSGATGWDGKWVRAP